MKTTVRNRRMIDRFTAIDGEPIVIDAIQWFIPDGTDLFYFKITEFEYEALGADDILEISHNGNVVYKQPHGMEKLRHDLKTEILTALNGIEKGK